MRTQTLSKRAPIAAPLVALLTAVLASQGAGAQAAPSSAGDAVTSSPPAITATYIANEGFLVEAAGKKALIDGLFDRGAPNYLVPSPELLDQIVAGKGPFTDIDLLLVTHAHGDHFAPAIVLRYLRAHPRCQLVAHKQVIDGLRGDESYNDVQKQVHELDLEPGARERVSHNGIALDVLCLKHMADDPAKEGVRNLAFVVELGGVRLLHLGDALVNQSEAYLKGYPFEQSPVDVLFLNQYDRSQTTQQFIGRKIKPSRIITMHVPPAELADELTNIHKAYPYAIVFRQSMERRSLSIEVDFHNLSGDYFGQTPPGATPQVFARGIVSTDDYEHCAPSFSPDGTEVFWYAVRRPGPDDKEAFFFDMTMRRENGRWSAPYVALNSYRVFSADGRRAYLGKPGDIRVFEKQGGTWGEPRGLGLVSRFPELTTMFLPSATRTGTLYHSSYAGGPPTNMRIYRTEFVNGEYVKPELLPPSINLPSFVNQAPFIAPDESYLLFSSNRRDPEHDDGDLYISRRQADGSWTDPVGLGEPVNSPGREVFPGLSPDGKYLFFGRGMPGGEHDVYWVDATTIPALRPADSPSKAGSR